MRLPFSHHDSFKNRPGKLWEGLIGGCYNGIDICLSYLKGMTGSEVWAREEEKKIPKGRELYPLGI